MYYRAVCDNRGLELLVNISVMVHISIFLKHMLRTSFMYVFLESSVLL